jgi:hypothetical protein
MWNNITDEDIERADTDFGVGGEPPDIMRFTQEGGRVSSPSETEQAEEAHEEAEGNV